MEENQYHITLMNWKTKEEKQLTDNTYKSQQAPVFVEPQPLIVLIQYSF